jgi:hypothetical protein
MPKIVNIFSVRKHQSAIEGRLLRIYHWGHQGKCIVTWRWGKIVGGSEGLPQTQLFDIFHPLNKGVLKHFNV